MGFMWMESFIIFIKMLISYKKYMTHGFLSDGFPEYFSDGNICVKHIKDRENSIKI